MSNVTRAAGVACQSRVSEWGVLDERPLLVGWFKPA